MNIELDASVAPPSFHFSAEGGDPVRLLPIRITELGDTEPSWWLVHGDAWLEDAVGLHILTAEERASWTTLAERPLFNWSPRHSGEALPVKLLEIPNVVPLLAAGILVYPFAMVVTAQQASWLRGAVFVLLATLQWSLIGRRLDRERAA